MEARHPPIHANNGDFNILEERHRCVVSVIVQTRSAGLFLYS